MIFFSIVEVVNKLLGLYITGALARILTSQQLGAYLSGLVMLGYALEIGFFGSQNRHNADYSLGAEYLQSTKYAARKTLTLLTSVGAVVFLLGSLRSVSATFEILPLLLVIAYVPITFDYVAYGSKRSQIVVLARLISQLVAVAWIYLVGRSVFEVRSLYWGSLLQTTTLTLVITGAVWWLKKLSHRDLSVGISRFPVRWADLRLAVRDQGTAFVLRILALALVSGEVLLLGFAGDKMSGQLATSLRLVQIIFPFTVFYVDSNITSISQQALDRFVRAVLFLTALLLVASPVLVVVLYGGSYAGEIFHINLFLPAFVMQALLQYFILLSIKQGNERELLGRLIVPVGSSLLAIALLIHWELALSTIAVIYVVKAALFILLIPSLTRRTRLVAGLALVIAVCGNLVLNAASYYEAVASLVLRVVHG